MSVEKAKAFVEKLKTDSALAKKLQDAQKAYTGDKSDRDAAIKAILLPIAAQAGFEFTLEELEEAFGDEKLSEEELSEEELEAVAGGKDKPPRGSAGPWRC